MNISYKFSSKNPNECLFFFQDRSVAIGEYVDDGFHLLIDQSDDIKQFANAMQAFSHIRSIFEPGLPSQKTIDLFTKPARAVDNWSKYRDNNILSNVSEDAMFAYRK